MPLAADHELDRHLLERVPSPVAPATRVLPRLPERLLDGAHELDGVAGDDVPPEGDGVDGPHRDHERFAANHRKGEAGRRRQGEMDDVAALETAGDAHVDMERGRGDRGPVLPGEHHARAEHAGNPTALVPASVRRQARVFEVQARLESDERRDPVSSCPDASRTNACRPGPAALGRVRRDDGKIVEGGRGRHVNPLPGYGLFEIVGVFERRRLVACAVPPCSPSRSCCPSPRARRTE